LENPDIRTRGQNIGFDSHFLLRSYGIKSRNSDDTMVAQRTIMPDYPIGLDFICSIWTDLAYYKDEGKKFFKGSGGRWETLWEYNCRDSHACSVAFPKQYEQVVALGNEAAYERQRLLIEPLTYMQERGIKVDVDGMIKRSAKMEVEIEELRDKLDSLTGGLNANSPKQISAYFYGKLGITPYKKKGGGAGATDEIAMKRLARRGYNEARLILDIRKLVKLRSTYIPVIDGKLTKVDDDGRIRCSYNPVGTKFSRLSSSANIFGTGMNMQNWPHDMLRYLVADDGYGYFSFDLAQAENRIVAYVGQVTPMIDAFERGADVHSLTGALISGKPYQQVIDEDKEGICCPPWWRYVHMAFLG
jgi:DNA polymerase-1